VFISPVFNNVSDNGNYLRNGRNGNTGVGEGTRRNDFGSATRTAACFLGCCFGVLRWVKNGILREFETKRREGN